MDESDGRRLSVRELPGIANAGTCCGNGGIGTGVYGCCNPSAVFVPLGIYENADCIATRCDPPFPCSGTDTCQPDGSCCTSLGATCAATFPPGYYFNPCCPDLEGSGVGDFGATCCVSDGGACRAARDCCSSNVPDAFSFDVHPGPSSMMGSSPDNRPT